MTDHPAQTPTDAPATAPLPAVIPADDKRFIRNRWLRWIVLGLGWVFVGLGVIGAFLPVMPTVPFLIVAIWCFSRSSKKLHHWLYSHPHFGPPLRDWDRYRVIPPRGKLFAVIGMAGSLTMVSIFVATDWVLPVVMGSIMLLVAAYVVTRPSHPPVRIGE